MYTKESIDRVREADIVSVIQHFCPDLKKKGSTYFCNSPFTNEKTASFNVNPVKNNWVCYSSSQFGDGIKFVELHDHVEFIEAVRTIANIANIYLEEEKVPEEVKRERKNQQELIALANNVAKKYQQNFNTLPDDHWAVHHIQNLGYSKETLINFQIGYAHSTNEITKGCIEKGKLAAAIAISVSSTNNNKSSDFFKERIMFPICNPTGDVIAFGGRRQNGEEFEKYPKYLNSKETEIYIKTETLYGYNHAKRFISKSGFAILTEGYTDVITMHEKGCYETVATCGTALTDQHIKQLKRLCEHVVLFRDGDVPGTKASIRDLNLLLAAGFRVSILMLPENEDPDSFARKQPEMRPYVIQNMVDAIEWRLYALAQEAEMGPHEKSAAIDTAIEMLHCIKNEVLRNEYIKITATILKEKQATLKNTLAEIQKAANDALEKQIGKPSHSQIGLPEGANHEQYLRDRFCEIGHQYYFTKGDGFFPGTDFIITPLFHIKGKKENKRLCEIVNTINEKQLIDLESDSFVSFSDFKKRLTHAGYYIFLSGSNTSHFDLLMQKILKEFVTALELQNMGWNSKGFYAFANGVFWKHKFQEVNKYGIIYLEGVDTDDDDEYNEKVEYYYSPAYSVMHKKNQDGDDPYENDRKFIYKKSGISLIQWMDKMVDVFQEKGRIGIVFNFATIFRDMFLKNYDFFPLLGGFGEKDSGKSGFGKILQNFFFYNLEPLELNQSTLVGFNRRLSRTTNTVVFLDEYNDRIDEKMFQAMKGAWNGLGREKGMATNDKRTIYDKVNSAIYYAGQYLPTRDDNSLATRTICMQFPSKTYSPQEKEAFNKLIAWTSQGISSLIVELLEYRPYFESNLPRVYNEVTRELKQELAEREYQERIFGNYLALLITYKILEDRITFPFSYISFFNLCVEGIIENSESVQDSNGLTEFWNIIQWMFERGYITEDVQFKIERSTQVKYIGNQKENLTFDNTTRKQILYLRLNSVHQDYLKEVTKREGVQPIGETTLRNYFKSRTYFIGLVRAKRFKDNVSSCYAFDYDEMTHKNIISLEKLPVEVSQQTTGAADETKDDLPF